jgi:hypothetical protein
MPSQSLSIVVVADGLSIATPEPRNSEPGVADRCHLMTFDPGFSPSSG